MAPRKVVMLAYHYPPLGGVAVMRALRFSRYLADWGWQPIVVCVDGGGRHEPRDPDLLQEIPAEVVVERVPCLEPDLYSDSWAHPREKVIRNLFKLFDRALFPDDRAFWIRPVVRRVEALVQRHRPSVLWATAQPWSTLVAGMRAKQRTGIPLVLDFRDDWTTSNADFRKTRHLARERELEQRVLSAADAVVSVTPQIIEALKQRRPAGQSEHRYHYLPNGFDPAHFAPPLPCPPPESPFTILHAGGLYEKRPISPLLDGLQAWIAQRPERRSSLQVILAGRCTPAVEREIADHPLADRFELRGFVSHREVRHLMQSSCVNLLMIEQVRSASWLFTGKVFEYLGARRPILMLGPDPSPLADLLRQSGLGNICPYGQPDRLAATLEELSTAHREGQSSVASAQVETFNARNQCAELAKIFEEVQS